ncbi:MAG: hypothetical protein WD575_00900 [Nitriliruptoraceae bacterium]
MRRRTPPLEIVDRLVAILMGLALLAAGAAILAIALDLLELPDLPAMVDTATAHLEAWPAAAVVAAAAVVTLLAAAFSIRHLLPARRHRTVSTLRLQSEEERHRTEIRGRAVSAVIEDDLGRLPSVRDSRARLVSADPPSIEASVTTSVTCDLDEVREHVAGVVDRLDHALGRSDVRMRVRIGFVGASPEGRVT